MVTQTELKEWLDYDPITGIFTWAKSRAHGKVQKGRRAGCLHPDGYNKIRLFDELFRAGRLAVLWMTGEFPEAVDHINLDRGDDRWINLRSCTRTENQCNHKKHSNNASGHKNVFWNKVRGKWQVKVNIEGQQYHGGFYEDLWEAAEQAVLLRQKIHGAFANHK